MSEASARHKDSHQGGATPRSGMGRSTQTAGVDRSLGQIETDSRRAEGVQTRLWRHRGIEILKGTTTKRVLTNRRSTLGSLRERLLGALHQVKQLVGKKSTKKNIIN